MITKKTIHRLITLDILCIFTLDYLKDDLNLIPRIFAWLPDLIAVILLLIFFLFLAQSKKVYLKKTYLIFFLIFFIHLFLGVVLNLVPAGAVFAGLRNYIRYLPLFFLPSVVDIEKASISKHMKLIFAIGMVQVPIAIYQRFFQYRELQTGDVITGTLTSAPFLVIFQLSVICFLMPKYIRGKIKLSSFLALSILLFLPCTINETKAVIILFPAAILAITYFTNNFNSILKRYIMIPSILIMMLAIFFSVYDYYSQRAWGVGLLDVIKRESLLKGYQYKGVTSSDEGAEIGRFDSIRIAYLSISENPIRAVFGYGMGNVLLSFHPSLKGEYMEYDKLGAKMTTLTALLWETGIGGFLLLLIFMAINFLDALSLREAVDLRGELALSWIGIGTMLFFSIIYVDLLHHNIGFLFSYLSGHIASARYRLHIDRSYLTP